MPTLTGGGGGRGAESMGGARAAAAAGGSGDASAQQDIPGGAADAKDEILQAFRTMAADAKAWSLRQELSGNDQISGEQVADLRRWCRDSGLLRNISDALLVAFLHCSRCDFEVAKSVIRVYESVRKGTPEVFSDRPVHGEEVQRAKGIGYFCLLPKKTPEGYRIIVQGLRNPDPSIFVYSSSSKAQFLTMDAAVRAEPTAEGYICIFDMQGVQMGHMWAIGMRLPRKIFKYLQEGLPLRMQRIHFVNTTSFMDTVMKMLRPFIRKELASIFRFHTVDDMDSLHEMIPRDCLPENYGGLLPPLERLQELSDVFLSEMDPILDT